MLPYRYIIIESTATHTEEFTDTSQWTILGHSTTLPKARQTIAHDAQASWKQREKGATSTPQEYFSPYLILKVEEHIQIDVQTNGECRLTWPQKYAPAKPTGSGAGLKYNTAGLPFPIQ